jgi:hypothetical protein
MDDKIAIPLIGSALLGAAMWFAKRPSELTDAQHRKRIDQLLKRGCTVWFEPIGHGDVAVMKRCP